MNLLETVSGLALKTLNPQQFESVRNFYYGLRGRLSPLFKYVYGTFDSADLRKHLETKLGNDFEILMVHSSVNHMLPMYTDTALDFVKALIAFCGSDKTLVMPAFYFGDPNIGSVNDTFAKNPRFDLKRTPSQMGLATELFRRTPGVLQSRHPVYRIAALGPLAKRITEGHELCDHPCGVGSPFDCMTQHKTLVIGIGKTFQVLTQVHHAEAIMGDEFPVPKGGEPGLPVIIVDGKVEVHSRLVGRNPIGRLNIWKLRSLMSETSLREWTFHHVPFFATLAEDVTASLVNAAKNGITLYDKP